MNWEKAGMEEYEEYGKRQERGAGAPGSCRRLSSVEVSSLGSVGEVAGVLASSGLRRLTAQT
jgi:hypothetical protein